MTALNEMLTFNRGVIFPHHPTRWARNGNKEAVLSDDLHESPSHTVGSEQGTLGKEEGHALCVSIPHGGLRTRYMHLTT